MSNKYKVGDTVPRPSEQEANEMLSNAIIRLYQRSPFRASVVQGMKRRITYSIPTAAVGLKEGQFTLSVNPQFFITLDNQEQEAVIEHECQHVTHDHFGRLMRTFGLTKDDIDNNDISIKNYYKYKRFNAAADIAINQTIHHIPSEAAVIKNDVVKAYGKLNTYAALVNIIPHALPNQPTEYYYHLLTEYVKKNGGEPELITLDEHDFQQLCDAVNAEEATEAAKRLVVNAEKAARGALTAEDQLAVSTLFKKHKNWKTELRRFIADASESIKVNTRTRRNRRYGIKQPGERVERLLNLAVVIDTSGSMYNEKVLSQLAAELNAIAGSAARVTVYEADSEVKRVYEYKKSLTPTFTGGGGTKFAPALEAAAKERPDGLIYLTDGENFDGDELKRPRFPVLWAITEGGRKPTTWGSFTEVKITP